MTRTWFLRLMALTVAVLLGACGGGGGGGGGGFPIGLPTANVTLNGSVTFDSVPNATGALNYAAVSAKPVRGAVVDVINSASTVLATTSTDANGAYSVSVPSNTTVVVRVKAQMLQGGSGASWDVSVRDNTQSDAIYAMESPSFSTGFDATLVRNLNAPSGWDGTRYSSTRVAGPFALLDTIYLAQAKVLSVAPATAFPLLRVFWSVNNVPASGNLALGQIGTTFFTSRDTGRAIYVLGREDVDTDEYDAPVIAHEWGHYYQSSFSRDDSPGGSHSLSELLDRRLAFSEGWGNAWSGIALGRSNYTDSAGPGQTQGAALNLAAGASSMPGWYREASIQSILWNLNNQVGFKPIHDTMTGPFKTGAAVSSIHPFAVAFNVAAPGSASALSGLLVGQNITVAPGDPFGNSETNNGGIGGAGGVLPMYRPAAVGGTTQACVTNTAGTVNKLGNFVYLRFTAPTARNYTVSISGPPSADPDLVVYAGRRVAQANAFGSTETATVGLQVGETVLAINDFNNTAACFNVNIQ